MKNFGHLYQYGEFKHGRIERRLTLLPSIFVVLQPATSASANKAFSCTFHCDHTLY